MNRIARALLGKPRGPKSRYRWACVAGEWHWWLVDDLARGVSPDCLMEYLP